MKLAPLVATLSVACALPAAAQLITVTKPAAGETVYKTSPGPYTITWTKVGTLSPTIDIVLRNSSDTADVLAVATGASNCGAQASCSYSWNTLSSAPVGSYRIRVKGTGFSGTSGVFTIKSGSGGPAVHGAQAVPALPVLKATQPPLPKLPPGGGSQVTITYPANSAEWELNHPYTIRWTANTVPDDGFEVDLYRLLDGGHVEQILSGAAKPEGPNSWSYEWKPWCNLPQVFYRIRVKSLYSGAQAMSASIKFMVRTKKLVENIPIQVENADIYYSNSGSYLVDCSRIIPPGKARVGYDLSMYKSKYGCHVFRSRLTFDLSRFAGKKGVVESAKLITGDLQQGQGCGAYPHPYCIGQLFMLNPGEDGKWKGFQAAAVPYQLTGWSAPFDPAGYNVAEAVSQLLKGAKPNLGFVVNYPLLPFNCGLGLGDTDAQEMCPSFFKPIMYVTFVETPDPCGAQ